LLVAVVVKAHLLAHYAAPLVVEQVDFVQL
jgi:hypothetical protein